MFIPKVTKKEPQGINCHLSVVLVRFELNAPINRLSTINCLVDFEKTHH